MGLRSNIYIAPELWKRFRLACLQVDTSASAKASELITSWLDDIEPRIEAARQKGAALVTVKKPPKKAA